MNRSTKEKKKLPWNQLGFGYIKTDWRFSARWEDGVWSDGSLVRSEMMEMHEGSQVLHYAQTCFEGLKAFTAPDGRILLFRPLLNSERLNQTAERLVMPQVPEELFMKAVLECIKANEAWVPPYGTGASLYIRPLLIGVGENLGLSPAKTYDFRVFVSPVGPYYKSGGMSQIKLAVIDLDRAAPLGTGHVKAGANYAGGLLATKKAKELGANEALYLDVAERRYLEEAGSANIVLKMTNNRFVTPKSSSILSSVTRRSVMTLAGKELNLKCEERPVDLRAELGEIEEFAACGTAAVLSPVSQILFDGRWHTFISEGAPNGPTMQQLYKNLTQIQLGEVEDKYGWTYEV